MKRTWRLSEIDKRSIVALYEAGEPISIIAACFGVARPYPGQLAKRKGVPQRRKQDHRAGNPLRPPPPSTTVA